MKLFITLLENVNKSRTSAGRLSLNVIGSTSLNFKTVLKVIINRRRKRRKYVVHNDEE
jgi:hypothetical protein